MKTELRIIVLLLFCAALSGCASQRGMQLHPASEERCRAAFAALSEGCFVIEVDEFFSAKPARNPVKAVLHCYVSMRDGHAEFLFPPARTMHLRSLADRLTIRILPSSHS